ncbi:MAG: hypothetical protein K2Q12_03640 [Rickettsiales bacterium]|nr:hypothetical protein [Rickettsiales bacterium]
MEILDIWQEQALFSDQEDLHDLLTHLQHDMVEQCAQGALDAATLRKTLYFLGVLMKVHPASTRRFASMLQKDQRLKQRQAAEARLPACHDA